MAAPRPQRAPRRGRPRDAPLERRKTRRRSALKGQADASEPVSNPSPQEEAAREWLLRSARAELPYALSLLRQRFPDETFYVLALQTTPQHDSLGLLGATEEEAERLGEAGIWEPRDWTRRLPDLSSLTETHDALDHLQGLARSAGQGPVDLSLLWIHLLAELRESGYTEAYGRPLLTVVGARRPSWREVAEELNPWVPWSEA